MPISATGNSERSFGRSKERGFSFLELLVVVAIIGLLAQAVVWSIGTLGNDREIEDETNRLRSMLDLLHEEALMQSRDYGVMFTETGYRFYVYDYEQLAWADPTTDRLLQAHALRPLLNLTLVLDGREVPIERDFASQDIENAEPQIMLLSSGEVTPFSIEISRENAEGRFTLTAELDGTVTVAQEDFD